MRSSSRHSYEKIKIEIICQVVIAVVSKFARNLWSQWACPTITRNVCVVRRKGRCGVWG